MATGVAVRAAGVGADVEHVEGDVRDGGTLAAAVARLAPEVIVHLAAQPLVRRSYDDPVETYATNVMGTVNLLDAAGAAARRASSSSSPRTSATPHATGERPIARATRWAARTPTRARRAPRSSSPRPIARRSSADGAAVATARAGNVFGGGDWGADRLLPDVFRAALAGAPSRIRNPDAVRPWQHVLNPLSGYLRLAERAWDDRAHAAGWNFGPAAEDARPVRWIVERLDELWDGPLRWDVDPGPHPHEAPWLKLDSSLARERLGWAPRWDLAEGLRRTVAWHLAHRDGVDLREATLAQVRAYTDGLA